MLGRCEAEELGRRVVVEEVEVVRLRRVTVEDDGQTSLWPCAVPEDQVDDGHEIDAEEARRLLDNRRAAEEGR